MKTDVPGPTFAGVAPGTGAGRESLGARWRRFGSGTTITTRLALIIAACLIPAVSLHLLITSHLWAERRAQLADLAVQQAELLAGDIASIAEGARILLTGAAEFSRLSSPQDECSGHLRSLQHNLPSFAFLAYLDANRRVVCASDPTLIGHMDDLAWVQNAHAVEMFTAGRFGRSDTYPGGFVPFYFPVGTAHPASEGMLVAALDLGWLEQHLHQLKRHGSSFLTAGVLTVADSDGVVLARDVRHAEFVGKQFPPEAMPAVRSARPGFLRIKSLDGTVRLVGYAPPSSESGNLAVAVGLYEPDLIGDIRRAMLHWELLFGCMAVAVLGLTLLVAWHSVARPTQRLVAVAQRWQEGDLTARAPEYGKTSEFGQIASAYNAMATALQFREDRLQAYADAQEHQVAERTSELVLANERLQREMIDRQATEQVLLQAQKVQAVGQLAGGIAHDFNNILQTVSGSAALMQRRANDPTAVRRLAHMIEDVARRGTSITRRLLTFSRRQELRAEVLDVREMVLDLHEVLAATLGVAVRVEVEVPEKLPSVWADRGQLETVIVNLATNARDAMPGGGVITISAATREILSSDTAEPVPPGNYVCLSVSDTGEGMSADILARATEPFFTTKGLGQGTGLGLTMARSFAEGSGGKLLISSELKQGTKASLWLPATSQEAPAAAPAPPSLAGVGHAQSRTLPRILLVDDDPTVREILAAPLLDEGYEVVEAEDAPTALALLQRDRPIDLLISDLAMPGPDGMALIREAQERQPALPAILITGYAGSAADLAIGRAIQGRFALLQKPVSRAQLLDQVAASTAFAPD